MVKNRPAIQETWVHSLGREDHLEKEWQPTPLFLPGEFAWTEEPGRLWSMGSQRVGHNLATNCNNANHFLVLSSNILQGVGGIILVFQMMLGETALLS